MPPSRLARVASSRVTGGLCHDCLHFFKNRVKEPDFAVNLVTPQVRYRVGSVKRYISKVKLLHSLLWLAANKG